MKSRAKDWFRQAQNDYLWAEDTLRCGRYAQCCFVCQQIAEKSLKAVAYHRGYDLVKSHSLVEIARSLKINGDIETISRKLDFYYITSRYPDAFPSGAPYEFFASDQAEEAVGFAARFLSFCANELDIQTSDDETPSG
ncbi:MAG: HEPN domain-containing protein [Spirochaetota bacterium]